MVEIGHSVARVGLPKPIGSSGRTPDLLSGHPKVLVQKVLARFLVSGQRLEVPVP